jgi:two-component system NtrC family sensor kinase
MRVLIAEDNRIARFALDKAVRDWGYETVCVNDGNEAWAVLQREDAPRLAILDWLMPGLDGVEVCRRARKRAAEQYVYIILLTARDQKQDLVEAMEAGADDYVTKPFDPGELKTRLNAGHRIVDLQRQVAEEMSARQEAQQERFRDLEQSRKLTAIGQLAFGIAHEINTPLQYLQANLPFLGEAFANLLQVISGGPAPERLNLNFLKEEVPAALRQSEEGIRHIARIVGAMKDFAKPGVEGKVNTNLNQSVRNAVDLSRSEWQPAAEVQLNLAEDLPDVLCLSCEINQVILNLITNAAQAISDSTNRGDGGKGTIVIETRLVESSVELSVRDNGVGIPENIQPRIFEPFVTTRDVGQGMGQGLAIAYSVITRKHGGTIRFQTEPGRGTTFTISLPVAVEEPEPILAG